MKAYHFTADTLRDGRPIPPVGEWLEHTGPIFPCESGLHASADPFDALKYAPGAIIHLVEIDGELVPHGDPVDKVAGRRRKIIKTIDATKLLREFARWCALRVIHLWDCPDVVRRYLETGDESMCDSVRDTAFASSQKYTLESDQYAAMASVWYSASPIASHSAWFSAWFSALAECGDSARDAHRAKFRELVNAAFDKEEQ